MKTTKLILGIISIVLFGLIIFQSCAAGIANTLEDNGESSGTAGTLLAAFMLAAGIIGISTRKGKAGGFVAGAFYLVGGLIALLSAGSFKDLVIWSVVSLIFGVVFVLGSILMKTDKQCDTEIKEENNEN